jgi:hypothetical protein
VAKPSIARIYEEVADRPAPLVDEQVLHVADIPVCRKYVIFCNLVAAAQMGFTMLPTFGIRFGIGPQVVCIGCAEFIRRLFYRPPLWCNPPDPSCYVTRTSPPAIANSS